MADALVEIVGGSGAARIRSREMPSMSSLPTTTHIPKVALPIAAAPSPPPAATRPSSRTWALVAGAALFLGGVVGVVAWQLSRPANEPQPSAPEPAEATTASTSSSPATADADTVDANGDAADAAVDAAAKPKTKTKTKPKKPKAL
jgi:hypothetical protein